MNRASQGKVVCTHCQMEMHQLNEKCQCHCNVMAVVKRHQRTVTSLSLLAVSCITIVVSACFWFLIFLDFRKYWLSHGHPFENYTFLFAGWCFFIGWYCLVITLAEVLSNHKISETKHKLIKKWFSKSKQD